MFVTDAPPRGGPVEFARANRVAWRVVAANNRAIGRSSQVYPSLVACRAAVDQLRRHSSEIQSSVLFDSDTGRWSWTVSLAGDAAAECVRSYLRRLECTRALGQFLTALSAAEGANWTVRNLGERALQRFPDPGEPA